MTNLITPSVKIFRPPLTVTELLPNVAPFSGKTIGEIHFWLINLAVENADLNPFFQILAVDERRRAEKFYFPNDRLKYIVRRAALRYILGNYCGIEPARIRFGYNEFGKPFLINETANNSVNFNISQTGEIAVCAVAFGAEVGVDVETIVKDKPNAEIAERFFSANEIEELRDTSADRKDAAFYRCWTRKESFIKAIGAGLSYPLQNFSVSTSAEFLSQISFAASPTQSWNTLTFAPASQIIASIACQNPCKILRVFELLLTNQFHTPTTTRFRAFGAAEFSLNSFSRP